MTRSIIPILALLILVGGLILALRQNETKPVNVASGSLDHAIPPPVFPLSTNESEGTGEVQINGQTSKTSNEIEVLSAAFRAIKYDPADRDTAERRISLLFQICSLLSPREAIEAVLALVAQA